MKGIAQEEIESFVLTESPIFSVARCFRSVGFTLACENVSAMFWRNVPLKTIDSRCRSFWLVLPPESKWLRSFRKRLIVGKVHLTCYDNLEVLVNGRSYVSRIESAVSAAVKARNQELAVEIILESDTPRSVRLRPY